MGFMWVRSGVGLVFDLNGCIGSDAMCMGF